jgi:hypothetical protein
MRRTAALAGDLALLLGGHRCKSAAFFSNSVHSILLVCLTTFRNGARRSTSPSRVGTHEALFAARSPSASEGQVNKACASRAVPDGNL